MPTFVPSLGMSMSRGQHDVALLLFTVPQVFARQSDPSSARVTPMLPYPNCCQR